MKDYEQKIPTRPPPPKNDLQSHTAYREGGSSVFQKEEEGRGESQFMCSDSPSSLHWHHRKAMYGMPPHLFSYPHPQWPPHAQVVPGVEVRHVFIHPQVAPI